MKGGVQCVEACASNDQGASADTDSKTAGQFKVRLSTGFTGRLGEVVWPAFAKRTLDVNSPRRTPMGMDS